MRILIKIFRAHFSRSFSKRTFNEKSQKKVPEKSSKVKSRRIGRDKKMECKAPAEAKYRSNLTVVRILARRATKQSAFLRTRIRLSL